MIEASPEALVEALVEADRGGHASVNADGRLTATLLEALSTDGTGRAIGVPEGLLADAGIVVSLRAHDGRFVYARPALRGQLPNGELSGSFIAERARFYEVGGRELLPLHHPAQEDGEPMRLSVNL